LRTTTWDGTLAHVAAKGGHVATLEYIAGELGNSALVVPRTDGGFTPAHSAAAENRQSKVANLKVLVMLVKRLGIDVLRAKTGDGSTIAHVAVGGSNVAALEYIADTLGNSALVVPRSSDGWNPAHVAAAWINRVDILKVLVTRFGVDALRATTSDGSTVAHVAATGGNIAALEYIADVLGDEARALLTPRSSDRWTPAHIAASLGHVHVLKVLVTRFGIDALRRRASTGDTTAYVAAERMQFKAVEYIESVNGGPMYL
jgi:ankyrin repeat protein